MLNCMLEMWKDTLDKGDYVCEKDSLSFMKSFICDKQQRVGVNNNISSWEKVVMEYSKAHTWNAFFLKFLVK